MRTHYWANSALADWLRGTPKPGAETSQGWADWRKLAKATHPYRFWIAEEGLDLLQKFVMWPVDKYHDVKYYINNRWISKSHALTAHPRDIEPGSWCDVGNRFLYCMFNELVDFIEIELAWSHIAWGNKEEREKYKMPGPVTWRAFNFFRRAWRCKQAGIDHLKWEMSLTQEDEFSNVLDDPFAGVPNHQAIAAKEKYDLYIWWTETRPARPDPSDASGWTAICERRRAASEAKGEGTDWVFSDDKTAEERAETRASLDLSNKIEAEYEAEDEAYMIRLIKIRQSLWT